MNIAVFCSASAAIDKECFEHAAAIGKWMAEERHRLVFGGSDQGLMREIFDSLHAHGGKCMGVLPEKFEKGGKCIPGMDVVVNTADLPERKEIMLDNAEAAIILPGGIGTLDELFTTLAQVGLRYRDTKVIIYNLNGYWDSLLALIEDLHRKGALHQEPSDLFTVVTTFEDLKKSLAIEK